MLSTKVLLPIIQKFHINNYSQFQIQMKLEKKLYYMNKNSSMLTKSVLAELIKLFSIDIS